MKTDTFELLFDDLAGHLDTVTKELRIHKAALRMVEANYPSEAENFKFWMAQSERLPEMTAPREYESTVQQLRELFVLLARESSSPATSSEPESHRKELPQGKD